jgi:hypothetical protein
MYITSGLTADAIASMRTVFSSIGRFEYSCRSPETKGQTFEANSAHCW